MRYFPEVLPLHGAHALKSCQFEVFLTPSISPAQASRQRQKMIPLDPRLVRAVKRNGPLGRVFLWGREGKYGAKAAGYSKAHLSHRCLECGPSNRPPGFGLREQGIIFKGRLLIQGMSGKIGERELRRFFLDRKRG